MLERVYRLLPTTELYWTNKLLARKYNKYNHRKMKKKKTVMLTMMEDFVVFWCFFFFNFSLQRKKLSFKLLHNPEKKLLENWMSTITRDIHFKSKFEKAL